MSSRRISWAVNRRDGTPLIVKGVIADVDDAGHVTIGNRASEIVEEVLAREPRPTEAYLVPGIELAHEVYQLVQAKHAAGVLVRDPLPRHPAEEEGSGVLQNDGVSAETLEIIDKALRLLHSQSIRYARSLGSSSSVVSMTDLRHSPVGADLTFLGRLAEGTERSDQETVFRKIDTVLNLLFWSPAMDTYEVPRSFWDAPLGKMLSQAKLRAINPGDLLSIGSAAEQLGVTRPAIYRWMDDGTLRFVHDNASGRYFVLRGDVEQLLEPGRPEIGIEQAQGSTEYPRIAEID
jgi:excisionase family DNA binding protein